MINIHTAPQRCDPTCRYLNRRHSAGHVMKLISKVLMLLLKPALFGPMRPFCSVLFCSVSLRLCSSSHKRREGHQKKTSLSRPPNSRPLGVSHSHLHVTPSPMGQTASSGVDPPRTSMGFWFLVNAGPRQRRGQTTEQTRVDDKTENDSRSRRKQRLLQQIQKDQARGGGAAAGSTRSR